MALLTTQMMGQQNQRLTEPVYRNVDEAKDTVQGRITGLLSMDSPLNKAVLTRAAELANARGLRNSSIATNMGSRALIENALPIAQQDAQTSFTQGRANQDAGNQFSLTNLNADITTSRDKTLAGYESARDKALAGYESARDRALAGFQSERDRALAGYDTAARTQQAQLSQQMAQLESRLQAERDKAMAGYDTAARQQQIQAQMEQLQKEYQLKGDLETKLQTQNAATSAQQTYQAQVDRYIAATQAEIGRINATEGLTDAQRTELSNNLVTRRNADIQLITDVASKADVWDSSWSSAVPLSYSTTTPAAPPPPPTATTGTTSSQLTSVPKTYQGPTVIVNGKTWTWRNSIKRYVSYTDGIQA